jgi:hypothetical protein
MNPKNVPRSERPHMIKHRCSLLPKPDFVLWSRFKGKERFKGHYGLKPFHYGKIQTKDMAEIDQTYKEKIREANRKALCTLLHTTLAMMPKQQRPTISHTSQDT